MPSRRLGVRSTFPGRLLGGIAVGVGDVSVADNPTTNIFRPAPEPGMLHAGSKGATMYKLSFCIAVVVAGGGGNSPNP